MRFSPIFRTSLGTATMARPKITLYVDTVSPFGYIAYYLLRHEEAFKACDITYVPILLGGLMNKCGNTPPLKIKNKDTWIARERLRWASQFSIPITQTLPPDFPAPTLPIMRVLCAVEASDKENANNGKNLTRALDTFYARYWVDAVATHKPEGFKETLEGLFGEEEAGRLLTASTTPEVKQSLITNTDQAFEVGAFGLPWFVCTNSAGETEGFFGVDHLGQVMQFLGLGRGEGKGWRALL